MARTGTGMMTSNTFSSGNDHWLDTDRKKLLEERQELIDAAKAGCMRAKATLMAHPYNVSKLTLEGKEII